MATHDMVHNHASKHKTATEDTVHHHASELKKATKDSRMGQPCPNCVALRLALLQPAVPA